MLRKRFFQGQKIFLTLQRAFKMSESESTDHQACDSETMQFFNTEEDFVKIDELAETARLRHTQIEDLDFQLRFVE